MITNVFNYGINSVYSYATKGVSSLIGVTQKVNDLRVAQMLACGAAGYIAQYPVKFVGGSMGLHPTEEEIQKLSEIGNAKILFLFVIMTIVAPIAEEIIYRKYLPDILLPKYYTLTNLQTAAVSSGAFGLVHSLNYFGTERTSKAFAMTAYQVCFCALILGPLCSIAKTKVGLTASILVHMGFNFHGAQIVIPEGKMKEVIKELSPTSILPGFIGIALGLTFFSLKHQLICRLGVYCFDQMLNSMPKDPSPKLL
ncbi:CPBP family intramembrane glutamic endopeptidase [Candidatus Neptunichlamydia sp. REUL1]|uniref:CPBP family intramembrane glutamic endopeptidase n=1 Tax=Candidatus Neptunichlamydia sp. REUL1 TaxID=3064277 RepID=UPI00292E3CEF|nr:CPBP family intramembrane glutamic endopeptidase [Candidatus Neptunochlamydia sp. REUL1]